MLLTHTSLTIVAVLLISCQAVWAKFDASTCGTAKGCMFAPKGCEKKNDCVFSFSYKPDGKELEMELEGKPSSDNGYISVGFSEDPKMGNDLVVFCARFGDSVKGGLARTVKPTRIERAAAFRKTTFYRTFSIEHALLSHKNSNNTGVQTVVSATKQDDAINCVIRQVKKPEDRPELFDLSGSYYILFARGPYVETNDTAELQNHTPQGRYVGDKVSLEDVSVGGANATESDGTEGTSKSDWSTCGTKKGCVFAPEGCEKTKDCTFRFSYKPVGKELEMELEGKPSSADGYIAVGFSEDPKMGYDMVVFCARFGDSVKGGLMRTVKPFRVENNTGVQTIVSATKNDDVINCVIRQVKKLEDRPELFDLGGSYYILFARGPYVEKNDTAELQNHTPQGRYVRQKVSLADVNVGGASKGDETEGTAESGWSTCGTKKGCVFAPEGCEKTKDCTFRFSYKPDGKELEMELEGKPSSADGYIAVGFSEDQKMGNDMVVFCARFGDSVKGGLMRNVKPFHVENNTGVQTIVSATKKDDVIKCVIRQVKKPEDRPELFDLGGSYYILFARGPYVEANDTAALQNHTPQGRYVGQKVSLADVSVGGASASKDDDTEGTAKPASESTDDDDKEHGPGESDWSTCGTKKGCVFAPEGCEKTDNCTFFFSYKPDGDELEMEIEGTPSSANGYVAIGFSEDEKMGNDLVVFCARFGDSVKGGLARTVKPTRVENNTGVQKIVSATKKDDTIRCVIRQVKKAKDRPELFELDLSYYILFARGPYVETNGKAEIQNHTPQGRYVGKKVSLEDVTVGGTESTNGGGESAKPTEASKAAGGISAIEFKAMTITFMFIQWLLI